MQMGNSMMINGRAVSYQIAGKGTPVVFVHGFGEDSEIWENQIEGLKDKFLIIAPDLPGNGKSDLVEDVSMEAMAGWLKDLLNNLKVNKCILIGHSMGGYVSLAFAEKYPERLIGLGLFHSTAYPDSEEKKAARRRSIEFIQQYGAAKFQEQAIPNLFSSSFKVKNPGKVQEIIVRYTNVQATVLVKYYEAMILRPGRSEILTKIDAPVLYLVGEQDNAVPMRQGLEQCHLPGLSYIHILKEAGHMGMLEEPVKSTAKLEKFFLDCEIAKP
jgi:pimeloyl-ACP methyl ester carboxylesterase